MMTNYVVCNYAKQGNFMGKSIYTEVTISIPLYLANPTQLEIPSTQTYKDNVFKNVSIQGSACSSCPSSTTCADSLCRPAQELFYCPTRGCLGISFLPNWGISVQLLFKLMCPLSIAMSDHPDIRWIWHNNLLPWNQHSINKQMNYQSLAKINK